MRPGEIIVDKYRVDSVIATGGMGTVFAATHLALGQRIAIKVLLPEAATQPEIIERFLREARATALLNNPHVIRIFDFGQVNGLPFIVMEFLNGHDLATELRLRGKLPVERVADYVLQACVGLAEAHARGIVHRDLKPGNLFLSHTIDGRVEVKVLDFGISKVLSDSATELELTKTSSVLGSAPFMSPEQIRCSKHVDTRSDIWSLGVILYRLVSGQHPFTGANRSAVVAQIVADPVRPLRELEPTVPAGFNRLVLRCLDKDPAGRPQSILEFARKLIEFAPGAAQCLESIEGISIAPPPERPTSSELSGKVRALAPAPALASSEGTRASVAEPSSAEYSSLASSALRVATTHPAGASVVWVVAASMGLLVTGATLWSMLRAVEPTTIVAPGAPPVLASDGALSGSSALLLISSGATSTVPDSTIELVPTPGVWSVNEPLESPPDQAAGTPSATASAAERSLAVGTPAARSAKAAQERVLPPSAPRATTAVLSSSKRTESRLRPPVTKDVTSPVLNNRGPSIWKKTK